MRRRTKAILVASHLLLLAAGGVFAWQSASRGGFFQQESAARSGKPARSPLAGYRPSKRWTGSEYARAWKALRGGIYTTRERVRLQRDLLERWAEVDLAAAIEAALGEAWDSDGGAGFDPYGPLLGVFAEALAANPQAGWDLIRGRQFGVGTGMLRRVWMEAVGSSNPLYLASRVGELSWRDRDRAVEICYEAICRDQGGLAAAEVFKVLAGFPADMVRPEQLMEFAEAVDHPGDPAALKEEILRLGADDRLAKVYAMFLGRALATKTPEEIAGQIVTLPDGVREEVVWTAIRETGGTDNLLELVDLLIAEDAWSKVGQREIVEQVQQLARASGAQAVAEWAVGLPVRNETTELFHRCVEIHLSGNPETAAAWIAGIPPGLWRDRAYAEFSQVSLNVHNNPRASSWALTQIADTDLKAEAEGWRSEWEKKTGWARQ